MKNVLDNIYSYHYATVKAAHSILWCSWSSKSSVWSEAFTVTNLKKKSSWDIRHVRWFEEIHISGTISVLLTQGTFKVSSHIRSLIIGTETVHKMLVSFDHLTQLMAQEDFIKFSCCESFKSYSLWSLNLSKTEHQEGMIIWWKGTLLD